MVNNSGFALCTAFSLGVTLFANVVVSCLFLQLNARVQKSKTHKKALCRDVNANLYLLTSPYLVEG